MPIIYIDGQSLMNNQKGLPRRAKVAIVYQSSANPVPTLSDSKIFWKNIGDRTNNQAEYLALLEALSIVATEFGKTKGGVEKATSVKIRSDSKLLVEQMKGRWKAEDPELAGLRDEAKGLMARMGPVELEWVPREMNYAGLWLEGLWKGPPVMVLP